jgi:putative ABC transport system ATP-binding protein
MGTTILLVTHDPELARRAQRNVHLMDGQLSDFRAYEPRPAAVGGSDAVGATLA